MSEKTRLLLPEIIAYLRSKGIPKGTIEQIRVAFLEDAITESKDVLYERIYTAVGLAIRRAYGFGAARIMRALKVFDEICGSVSSDDKFWDDVMEELDMETGIVIRSGDEDERLICEYQGRSLKRYKEIKDKEAETKNA